MKSLLCPPFQSSFQPPFSTPLFNPPFQPPFSTPLFNPPFPLSCPFPLTAFFGIFCLKAINVSGFDFHLCDADYAAGGHVFDLQVGRPSFEVTPIFDFGMHLLHTPLFEQVDLSRDDDTATGAVEKPPSPKPPS